MDAFAKILAAPLFEALYYFTILVQNAFQPLIGLYVDNISINLIHDRLLLSHSCKVKIFA